MNRFSKARGFLVGALVVLAGTLLRGAMDGPRAPKMPGGRAIRVEVLNGSSVSRAGIRLAEKLRDAGFDVVDVRNAERSDYEATLVLDRVGEKRWADAVAKRLGAGQPRRQRNDDLLLEVTVILGTDLADKYGGKR